MIRIAVCDDEKEIRAYLTRRINDILAAEDIDGTVECFPDGQPLVEAYEISKRKRDNSLC